MEEINSNEVVETDIMVLKKLRYQSMNTRWGNPNYFLLRKKIEQMEKNIAIWRREQRENDIKEIDAIIRKKRKVFDIHLKKRLGITIEQGGKENESKNRRNRDRRNT